MFATELNLFCPGVVPVLVGPLQILLTILPGLLVALFGGILTLFSPSGMKNLAKLLWRQKVVVLVLALVVAGAVFAYQSIGPASLGSTTEAQQGSDWPTARGDLRRTGALPGTPSPTRPRLIWSFKQGNEGFLSSPAIVGNRLYVASANLGAFSKTGMIFCLDTKNGEVVWANAPENYRPTFSSPVVVGDYLVCGEGLHDTRDARIICMDISQAKNGEILWTFETRNHVECTPVVANGRVYVGAGDDGLYCLDLKPGPNRQARVLWHLPTEKYPDAETSLAVHDGKVYAGLGNDGLALCVLDAVTGEELQRVAMPYPVFGPPSIDRGKIYFGMGNGDYTKTGTGGAVRCMDLKTLKEEWTFPLKQTVLGAVAVKEDRLYFGSRDGLVYALTRNGKMTASFDAHGGIVTSPAVTDQAVYVATEAGLLFALDRHTLEPLWEFRLGTKPYFISSPVVAHGHVYVGTQNDGFLCVGEPSSERVQPLWTNPLGGPGRAGNRDNSPIGGEPKVYWQFPGPSVKGENLVPSAISCWGDDLYVPFTTGKDTGIACLSRKSNTTPEPRWIYRTSLLDEPPVVLDDLLLFVEKSGNPGTLHCLDRSKGTRLWTKDGFAASASKTLTVTGQHILVQKDSNVISCLDRDGNTLWTRAVGTLAHPPASSPNMTLVPSLSGPLANWDGRVPLVPCVGALDKEEGDVLWAATAEAPRTSPAPDRQRFFIGTDQGFEARSLVNGGPLPGFRCDGGVPSAEFAMRNQGIVYVNKAGELVLVDRSTGKVKRRLAGALAGLPPLASRGQAIVAVDKALSIVNLDQDEPQLQLWFEMDDHGPPIAPMVLHDSRVYVPTRRHGLVCIGDEK